MGSSRTASRDASPSKYVPRSVCIRPIALSRFVSSNSSFTNERSAPRSPRNRSSVRGRRPSPSAKFWPERLVQRLSRAGVDLLGLAHELLELRPNDVDVDGRARILEREQPDPQGPFDERRTILRRALPQDRREGRVADDQAVDDDPVGSTETSAGVGSWTIRASMTGILGPACDS